jgi:hypothetical protein
LKLGFTDFTVKISEEKESSGQAEIAPTRTTKSKDFLDGQSQRNNQSPLTLVAEENDGFCFGL